MIVYSPSIPQALRPFGLLPLALIQLASQAFSFEAPQQTALREATHEKAPVPLLHNGGGAYFFADPGELRITVFRSDRLKQVSHWDTDREMEVRLFDPVRELLIKKVVPSPPDTRAMDDWSTVVTTDLELQIDQAGVYFLLVTMKRDSYIESTRWGIQTNAKHYLIDAGVGHRDAARKEAIKFLALQGNPRIAFRPRSSIFSISAIDLEGAKGKTLKIHGGTDDPELLQERELTGDRFHTVLSLDKLEQLVVDLPVKSGEIIIEGVTLPPETGGDWIPLWTPNPNADFKLEATHWSMRPRHQVKSRTEKALVQIDPGSRNMSGTVEIIDESSAGHSIREQYPLSLAAGVENAITVNAPTDSKTTSTRVRFESDIFPPVEGLVAWQGEEIGKKNLVLPLALRPFRHTPADFGFDPAATPSAEVYFSHDGRAWFAGENGFFVHDETGWVEFRSDEAGYGTPLTERLFADREGRVYGLTGKGRERFLLAFRFPEGLISALPLPESIRGRVVIETNTSPRRGDHPPLVLSYERRGQNPRDPKVIWGVDHRLSVLIPEWDRDALKVGNMTIVSEHCIGLADHSGRSAPITTLGDQSFIIYGETSPPEASDPGVPTYVVPIDRHSGKAGARNRVGYAPPANDVHNVSSILTDSEGFLHVITGAHNDSFGYTRSLRPMDPSNWQPNIAVAPGYDQTYVGSVIDAEDRLHLVSRIWRRGPHFPGDPFDTALVHQIRQKGESWSQPNILLTAPLPHYGIYYHRLTIAPQGAVHLAWTHWPTWSSYRNELPGLGPPGNAFGYLHWKWEHPSLPWAWQVDWTKLDSKR